MFFTSKQAFFDTKYLTTSKWLFWTALHNGVFPYSSSASIYAPFSIRIFTQFKQPDSAARIKGVHLWKN